MLAPNIAHNIAITAGHSHPRPEPEYGLKLIVPVLGVHWSTHTFGVPILPPTQWHQRTVCGLFCVLHIRIMMTNRSTQWLRMLQAWWTLNVAECWFAWLKMICWKKEGGFIIKNWAGVGGLALWRFKRHKVRIMGFICMLWGMKRPRIWSKDWLHSSTGKCLLYYDLWALGFINRQYLLCSILLW